MKKIFIILFFILFSSKVSHAIIEIDITEGNREPLPIAITEFFHDDNDKLLKNNIPNRIRKVIADDLERSGLFDSLDQKAFIQQNKAMHISPRFADWRLIKAQGLLTGDLSIENERLRVEFRLWDTLAEKEIEGLVLITTINNWRRISHMIADKIYERLTGEEGYFDTRIVYVAEEGPKNKRIKKLAIMDQDGANHKFLTSGKELVLTPRFNPVRQEITYLSYFKNLPRVYLLNIQNGIQEVVGDFPGMTFAPRFSPDGNKIIMSLARDGNSDIYVMDMISRVVERLTDSQAIDTSPSYSPDGKKITFNSDRGGSQQIYVMDSNGRNQKRISKGTGNYATPVWSPRGDLIAFTKNFQGQYFIGVMRTDGTGERLLTENWYQEAPSWSSNGRVLIFYRETKANDAGDGHSSSIWSIDLTGFNERKLETPLDASDPSWSKLIQ
ncbi:Tol-Pal system beta propeller repeat protein TolB [Pelagibacteraceae bacterium]|nr:Tol-Pal system beta propeller repeat protein TolB [Pelagibacteraceae bacterium]